MRIFTLEEMFASGKEMGKGCVAVHTIGDFLFWMKNTTGLLSAQNFRRKRILFVRTRSSSLNWTIFFWGKSFHKRLCRRKIFKIAERYAHLIICAILRKLGSVGLRCNSGPLHMSPIDRASPVTDIPPHSYFLCKNFDVFIWEGGPARLPGWKFFNYACR